MKSTTRDTIRDFIHGEKIDLSLIDASKKKVGNQPFSFVSKFTGVAGQLQWDKFSAKNYLVTADLNGDKVADFSLRIVLGKTTDKITSADFIL